jgi:hypothetical protein
MRRSRVSPLSVWRGVFRTLSNISAYIAAADISGGRLSSVLGSLLRGESSVERTALSFSLVPDLRVVTYHTI